MKNKRIDTTPTQSNPLNNQFSSLRLDDLPPFLEADAAPDATAQPVLKMGRVVLRKETSGRGGKAVIVISEFEAVHNQQYLAELCARIKKSCGTGGTLRDREIEIQGEQSNRIRSLLEAEGFRVAGIK